MELDEFKSLWTKNLAADQQSSLQKDELNTVFLGAATELSKLTRASKFWWRVSFSGVVLLVLLSITTAILYVLFPDRLRSLMNAIPALITLVLFIVLTGRLYYYQARVFEVYGSPNMSSALRQAIVRFTKWYRISIVTYAVVLTPVFYFLTVAVGYKLDVSLSLTLQLFISLVLMLLTLFFNHIHYKRTYFAWLNHLKSSLAELEKASK